ncbi:MAG: hypothetical protein KDA84_01455, partial [Planctomycetaceae bacterium]|nr:hypothetical protein [Planctomycetaceae bacterium]
MSHVSSDRIPVVNLAEFEREDSASQRVAEEIQNACQESGVFYISGNGDSEEL